MVFLQELLSTLIQASERSWKGQMNEDQLKCKLRSLENQLYTCAQKHSEESVTKVLMEMEDQKQNYERKAKESLQKLLEEKMMAERQLQSTKRSLAGAEQECAQWKAQYEVLKEEWSDLAAKHSELETQLHILQCKLQGADSRDLQLNRALQLLETEHRDLQARLDLLQEDEAQGSQDAQELQGKLQKSEEEKLNLIAKVQHLQSVVQSQSIQLQAWEELIWKKGQQTPFGRF
ncbi:TRAF3-interacting JNK-activating modulator [Tachyglossus aculeatus]|uniref:TRAF3-interacting JNK-activating modulator n=1 Tax=Tachyglossus aculeatus TaxID=9261 RepID=UPI0018F3D3F3|nr:TRAF3-interacting JNK-activating modulator [Tachyglossus aculeatus]